MKVIENDVYKWWSMLVFVWMFVCMYVCMNVCVYMCDVRACVWERERGDVWMCMCVCVYVLMYVWMCGCKDFCSDVWYMNEWMSEWKDKFRC